MIAIRQIGVVGEQIAVAAADRDARHHACAGNASWVRASAKPRNTYSYGTIEAGVALFSGWPGERIGERRHQRADPRGGRILLAPMDRRKQHAALLPLADHDFKNALPVVGGDTRKTAVADAGFPGIVGMNLDIGFGQMLAQPRTGAGPGHGVPLVADTAGVQPQRPPGMGFGPQRRDFRRGRSARGDR